MISNLIVPIFRLDREAVAKWSRSGHEPVVSLRCGCEPVRCAPDTGRKTVAKWSRRVREVVTSNDYQPFLHTSVTPRDGGWNHSGVVAGGPYPPGYRFLPRVSSKDATLI